MQPELNEQALIVAWTRVRELTASSAQPGIDEVRALELALRPVAGAAEIQRGIVPLLDRTELYGLAMAWDTDASPDANAWQFARVERWLKLGAPEFALITLAQLSGLGVPIADWKARAVGQLLEQREQRTALLQQNLSALADVDPELVHHLRAYPRLSVGLQPIGAGVAEFSSQGGSHLQLWAATPADAVAEAEQLIARCAVHGECFIAGVGDGTLPVTAMRVQEVATAGGSGTRLIAHVVEPNPARIRALFEIVDLAGALREGRIWLHAGSRAVDTLAAVFARKPWLPETVVGGDSLATSLMETAAGRSLTR